MPQVPHPQGFKSLQEWELHPCPRLYSPFHGEILPDIQPEFLLVQLEVIPSYPAPGFLGLEPDPTWLPPPVDATSATRLQHSSASPGDLHSQSWDHLLGSPHPNRGHAPKKRWKRTLQPKCEITRGLTWKNWARKRRRIHLKRLGRSQHNGLK